MKGINTSSEDFEFLSNRMSRNGGKATLAVNNLRFMNQLRSYDQDVNILEK